MCHRGDGEILGRTCGVVHFPLEGGLRGVSGKNLWRSPSRNKGGLGTVRHCGFNPQSPEYNALNTGIAGQARNDEEKNNLENPKNLTKIKVQTKEDATLFRTAFDFSFLIQLFANY